MNYKNTMTACFVGYIVQAIVNNFVPLLFITFQQEYGIPLSKITLLITINFLVQLGVDLLSAFFTDKIGYRMSAVFAHIMSAMGLILLAVLPEIMPPFAGILTAVIIYAVGGGLLEVIISPITESCPTENKEKAMSMLHSFYCWGQVGVVLLSTLFFAVMGTSHWKTAACLWALIPIVNGIIFLKVPIAPLVEEGTECMTFRELFANKFFMQLMLMMLCAGASELAVSQWSSFFAEKALHISKTAGDLAGPMSFAVLMGCSRTIYGKFGEKINIDKFMTLSGILCVISYLMISVIKFPVINLIGCAICGLSVGIMWPGTYSKGAAGLKRGGTAMFSLLALAGDLGCSGGPTLVGCVANVTGDMKTGILAAAILPLIFTIVTQFIKSKENSL